MQRLARLDGLRGALAVYVMLGHTLPFTNLPASLQQPFSHGEAAVDLFFCLSGLVLLSSLERHGGAFWPFILARARRLLPVYLPVLAFATGGLLLGDPLAAMPWAGVAARHIWATGLPPDTGWQLAAHILLIHGLLPQGALPYAYVTLLGPAWSLSTEWQFYVAMGLLAAARPLRFAWGLLGLGVAWHFAAPAGWWQFSRAFLPDAAPFFALGLTSAAWLRGGGVRDLLVCTLAVTALAALSSPEKALVPLLWALAMYAQRQPWGALLESRVARWLGAISYPLYLLNEPIARALACLLVPLARGDALLFTCLWLPAALLLPIAAAAFAHRHIERRFMRQDNKNLPIRIVTVAGQ